MSSEVPSHLRSTETWLICRKDLNTSQITVIPGLATSGSSYVGRDVASVQGILRLLQLLCGICEVKAWG